MGLTSNGAHTTRSAVGSTLGNGIVIVYFLRGHQTMRRNGNDFGPAATHFQTACRPLPEHGHHTPSRQIPYNAFTLSWVIFARSVSGTPSNSSSSTSFEQGQVESVCG